MIDRIQNKIDKNNVIAYTGAFGTGKTTTLDKYFSNNSKKYEVIFFNAWEFDFSKSPKTVFINELLISIYKKSEISKVITGYMMKALTLSKNLVINKMANKGISFKSTETNEFKQYISDYQTESEKIKKLKRLISKITEKITKKLVLVIDDLDRSRPDFALEIFEISKHIFDVQNISIILVYDNNSMNKMISKKYG